MPKSTLSEKELNNASFYDLSIQTLTDGKDALILICKEKEVCSKLMDILTHNAFDLKIIVDATTGKYSLVFDFIDAQMGFKFDSGLDEKTYPPIDKLKNNKIKFITTGVWVGKSQQGRACEYLPPMRLGEFDPSKSFSQAKEVQFVSGRSETEPSIVLLIYDNHDQIIETEADEAYNRLMKKTVSSPHLEISSVDSEKINLRISDILVDLDVKFNGLKYNKEQLDDFLEKTDRKHSFGFALGYFPTDDTRAVIASTKRDGFEIITLRGYTYKGN